MSADIDRSKLAILKTGGNVNRQDFFSNGKNDHYQVASRHYSFSQDDKAVCQKRRNSEKFTYGSAACNFRRRYSRGAGRGNSGRIVLPTKFLLGGNISDPLNLNSLSDEAVNRLLNEFTPVASPILNPENKVPIIQPLNIHDPLNLEDSNENANILKVSPQKNLRQRKRRHSHKKQGKVPEKPENEPQLTVESSLLKPLSIDIDAAAAASGSDICAGTLTKDNKNLGDFSSKKFADKIVSPVIPQTSPKRKRWRVNSECKPPDIREAPSLAVTAVVEKERSAKNEKVGAVRSKSKRNSATSGFKGKNARFVFGNYSTFRGYRSQLDEDSRLKMFSRGMFEGKDVLDIGCNVGHMTIGVAENFAPRSITGIDVDGKLIDAAKKNLRFYLSEQMDAGFPVSLKIMRGPLLAHPLLRTGLVEEQGAFPHNVSFRKENYVVEGGRDVPEKPKYDIIMALGVSKWIHLNYGDAGLKRCFRRMYQQLRPGGSLILESQKWSSYRKKKKLTEQTYQIYKSLQFRPDQFREFLTSKEVGFASCQFLGSPPSKSKGSSSTVHIFTKECERTFDKRESSFLIPANVQKDFDMDLAPGLPPGWLEGTDSCSSAGWHEVGSARFELGSSRFTCSTCDNSLTSADASRTGTPWTDRTCSSVECRNGKGASPTFFTNRLDECDAGNGVENEMDDTAETLWHDTSNGLPDGNDGH